ncbi:MAG: YihY/virulence factor BrkB family protein [Opitutales bacterium]
MLRRLRRFVFRYASRWMISDGFGLAAAFSFYCIFAVAPLLAFAMGLSGYFLSAEQAREGTIEWLQNYLAPETARDFVELLKVGQWSNLNWVYTGFTGIVFLWGASLAFVRLRIAVNLLLGNESESIRRAIRNSVVGRLSSIGLTLAMGVLTGLFIVLTTGSTGLARGVEALSGESFALVVRGMSVLFAGGVIVAIVQVLPDKNRPTWRATSLCVGFVLLTFALGRSLLDLQVMHGAFASAYGAANTLVIFLFWVFYSAQALLLGINLCAPLDEVFFRAEEGNGENAGADTEGRG